MSSLKNVSSGAPWDVSGPILFTIFISYWENGTECMLSKLTDNIQLGGCTTQHFPLCVCNSLYSALSISHAASCHPPFFWHNGWLLLHPTNVDAEQGPCVPWALHLWAPSTLQAGLLHPMPKDGHRQHKFEEGREPRDSRGRAKGGVVSGPVAQGLYMDSMGASCSSQAASWTPLDYNEVLQRRITMDHKLNISQWCALLLQKTPMETILGCFKNSIACRSKWFCHSI